MELDLKEFSLTLAVGLAMAGIVYVALSQTYKEHAQRLAPMFAAEQKLLILVAGSVVILALGILCEDISKGGLSDDGDEVAFSSQLKHILEAEACSRFRELITFKDPKGSRFADPCSGSYVPKPTDNLGTQIFDTLDTLVTRPIATIEERAVLTRFRQCLLQKDCTIAKFQQAAQTLYYLAKNTVYQSPIYAKDLDQFRARFDFERTIVFVLLVGIYFVGFLYVIQSSQLMWRDVGGWKSLVSIALAIVAFIALLDVLLPLRSMGKICHSAGVEFCQLLGDPSTRETRSSSLRAAQDWLLPAAAVFIAMYRTRRVWKRLGKNLLQARSSTFAGAKLLQFPREIQGGNILLMLVCLGLIALPVRYAYLADVDAYLKRVFGYYQLLRDSAMVTPATKTLSRGDP